MVCHLTLSIQPDSSVADLSGVGGRGAGFDFGYNNEQYKKGVLMYAVEFETKIDNGIVHIPKDIDGFNQIKKAKFIMMYDNDDIANTSFNREDLHRMDSVDMIFDKFSIDMSKIKFDRDEANER